jgi:hypothetical protein
MPKLSVGSIQRTARITSLILGLVPILVFLGFTIELLIAKYYALPPYGLTWSDFEAAFSGQLLGGLILGGPLLIARFVAERKPLVGALIMLILSIYFILLPFISYDMERWGAVIGLIYIVPAVLYLLSWRRGRL